MPRSSALISQTLPDAVAVQVGAARWHRAGLTGRGITIALVDSGARAGPWFDDRGYRFHGDARATHQHADQLAAILFAVAPDAEVWSFPVEPDPAGALGEGLARCMFAVAAWDVQTPTGVAGLPLARCVAAQGPRRGWPGTGTGVVGITPRSPWPQGPFLCELFPAGVAGLSAAVAIAAGIAALLLSAGGLSPERALVLSAASRPHDLPLRIENDRIRVVDTHTEDAPA